MASIPTAGTYLGMSRSTGLCVLYVPWYVPGRQCYGGYFRFNVKHHVPHKADHKPLQPPRINEAQERLVRKGTAVVISNVCTPGQFERTVAAFDTLEVGCGEAALGNGEPRRPGDLPALETWSGVRDAIVWSSDSRRVIFNESSLSHSEPKRERATAHLNRANPLRAESAATHRQSKLNNGQRFTSRFLCVSAKLAAQFSRRQAETAGTKSGENSC
ncbi:hypothetical protein FB451DRAFT_1369364 [Mycena latifolia]|nr:hypothetical protein FB451DRAFT_1369364 [Mycena latifolia]